jgi:uncharacterized protein (DUF1499 family)
VNGHKRGKSTARQLSLLGLGLAVLCALAAALSGLGHRGGLWDYATGFSILRWAAYFGLGVAAMSACAGLYAVFARAWLGIGLAGLAMAVGLASAGVPWAFLQQARRAPPIHDITTDTEYPPRFVDILPLRQGAENPPEHGGPLVVAHQLKSYPDLGSVTYRLPPDQVFERTVAVVRELGWTIVAAVRAEGRIEATDRTFWFGFTDDIVIRIQNDEKGSVVDIRSVSRVGRSDLGVNAARVQAFIDKLIAGSVE